MKIKQKLQKMEYRNIISFCYTITIFCFALLQSEIQYTISGTNYVFKAIIIIASLSAVIVKLVYMKKNSIEINKKNIVLIGFFGALLLYNVIHNDLTSNLLFIILFMWLFEDIEIEKIFMAYSIGTFAAVFLVVALCKTGVLINEFVNSKNYLGFIYSTFGPNLFFHACLSLVAWRKDNIPLWTWIIIITANIWLYEMTDTTAVFVLVIALFVLYYLLKIKTISNFIKENKIVKKVIIYLPIIFIIFTIIFQVLYNNFYNQEFFIDLNRLLSGRLRLTKLAYENYSITLFGQQIEWTSHTSTNSATSTYFYVDSSYLQVLLNSGIVMLVVLCIIMMCIYKYAVNGKNIFLSLALTVFLIHCIADPQLLSFRYNPFLLTILMVISQLAKDKKTKEEKNAEIEVELESERRNTSKWQKKALQKTTSIT